MEDPNGIEIAKSLLDKGVSPTAADVSGNTPLHMAAAAGLIQNMEWLLQQGVDVDAMNDGADTPLDYAAKKGYTEAANCFFV